MRERRNASIVDRIDRWLRRENTWFARGVHKICPLEGEAYRKSRYKKGFDYTVAGAMLVGTALPVACCAVVKHVEDGGPAFYKTKRVGLGGKEVPVVKIRTMCVGAEDMMDHGATQVSNRVNGSANDPRATSFGRLLRGCAIDEMPQVFGVLQGYYRFIGPRISTRVAMDDVRASCPSSYQVWEDGYYDSCGLASLATSGGHRGIDARRADADLVLMRRQSLGTDAYTLWRNALYVIKGSGNKACDNVLAEN